jgi:thymidylate synthase (FAD)
VKPIIGSNNHPNYTQMFLGEVPRTTFINMEDSIRVQLISVHHPLNALSEMVQTTQSVDPPEPVDDPRLQAALAGKGMWMLEEIPQLIFKVTGVSRVFTHQLVRHRIGVTLMQQSTESCDIRHCDIITPGCIAANEDHWEMFKDSVLRSKMTYAIFLDQGMSFHSARYLLPHGISTFIYFQASLAAVAAIYRRRICTMSQTWEMYLFASRMYEAIAAEHPEFLDLVKNPCDNGSCWYHKVRETGVEPPLWQPDAAHDKFGWLPGDYMYPGTNQTCSSPAEDLLPKSYIGLEEVN